MKIVQPIYGQDYAPGFSGFSYYEDNILSSGISWMETIEEAQLFLLKLNESYSPKFDKTPLGRPASHGFRVVNKTTLIESSVNGVEYSHDLQERINDPRLRLVFREPRRLNELAISQMLAYGAKLEGQEKPYDYTGLLGAALRIISPLSKLFPIFNRLPNPLSLNGLYCTAFDADCSRHSEEYRDEKIFQDYHVTRIDPVIWWYNFPWKPLRFEDRKGIKV